MADLNTSQLNEALQSATREAQNLARAHSQLVTQINRDAAETSGTQQRAKATQDKQNKLDDKANKLKKEYLDLAAKEAKALSLLTALQEKANKLAAAGNQHTQEYIDTVKKINEASAAASEASDKSAASLHSLNQATGSLGKGIKWGEASVRLFGAAMTSQAKQLVAQYKASGGVVEGSGNLLMDMWKQQTNALKQGVTGEELAKESKAHRQTINAMGGTSEALSQLDPSLKEFRALTGSASEGLQLTLDSAQDLARKGVKPAEAAMGAYRNDLVTLTKYTGMSGDAARNFYNDIADDADSIDILRSARADEREAIIQSQRALVQQSIAAGMSADQAKNAAKMLNKMVSAKPLDRIKQAAKVRALGAAMGVSGADEAATEITKGKRGDQAVIQKFNQDLANKMDQAAEQGLGTEIFATELASKLGLEDQYGKGSPFSTTLGESLAPTTKAIDDLHKTSEGLQGKMVDYLALITGGVGVLSSGAFIGGTVATAVAAAFLNKGILKTLGGLLGGGAGDAGGAASKAGNVLKAGGRMLVRGGAGYALGAGAEMGADALKESGHEKLGAGASILGDTASYALMGSALGPMGALAGGALGLGVGLYKNWDTITGATPGDQQGPVAQLSQPAANKPKGDASKATKDEDTKLMMVLSTTSDGVTKQIAQMDASNTLLQQLADTAQKQVDIAEKQLIAITLTDKEKANTANRANLRADNKFGSQYGYV